MSRPLRHLRASLTALLGFVAALGGGSCAGTPLPEPPDALPRPDITRFSAEDAGAAPANIPLSTVAVIPVAAGAVPEGAELWIINLDAPEAPSMRLSEPAGGWGSSYQLPASAGDRVRLLFATDRAHSPPLDLVVVERDPASTLLPVAPLGDTSLACLKVNPSETLVLSGTRGTLSIANECGVAVALTRAALRTGAEGIRLAALPAAQIGAGSQLELILEDTRGPGPSERLDVLLLDVSAGDGRSGRYAIDVFSDLR